ncbi:LAME_0C07030g1_1 [Lachancea meyersii CBS 8951]|uniref:LAME_0C07030g1_1 n=1 Tax=Lachancea meyersii CBS 8951 TaxID=1266667 RepID=A0A1G4J2T4_9SACH|nr:LAME_0C07030g1_1 [Lachancea meyersii CBS 8951]
MKNASELCEKLDLAFKEYENDALSLVTVIDLYSIDFIKGGSLPDKAAFLRALHVNLQKNPQTVEKIGWDLPKILLRFLAPKHLDFSLSLSNNPVTSMVLKCFYEISLAGNAKECFLAGCELLGELDMQTLEPEDDGAFEDDTDDETDAPENETDNTVSGELDQKISDTENDWAGVATLNREPEEYFLELKLYALIEFIATTMKRIHTCYPSRFLAAAVGAIFSFIRNNAARIDDCIFVLRRIYAFSRNYIPPQHQSEAVKDLTSEEYSALVEDENALQRKLLQCLITHSLGQLLQNRRMCTATEYVLNLRNIDVSNLNYELRNIMRSLVARYYQLALSFDIDIEAAFRSQCISESVSIYQSLPQDSEVVNEEAKSGITQLIYQLAHTYCLQKKITEKNLSLDPHGILVLATYHYQETRKILCPDIKIDEAICMSLRFYTPEVYSDSNPNSYANESCQFWIWAAVMNSTCKESRYALSKIPSYLLATFLQIQLLSAFSETLEYSRMVAFTLLTRLMCLAPESDAFEFVRDTLLHCPSMDMKCCILGILKDLMLNVQGATAKTTEMLAGLKISSETKASSKPELPARPYVMVNEDRKATIHSLAIMSFEESKKVPVKQNLLLSLNFLNFFISLRLKWDKALLKVIQQNANELVEAIKDKSEPEIGFIQIASENLKSYLSQ